MATSTVFESVVTETIRVSLALGDGISLPPGGATSDLAAISAQVSATITEMGTAYDTAGTLPINEQKIFDEEEVPTHPLLAAQTLFAKATDSAALGIALFLPAETWAC